MNIRYLIFLLICYSNIYGQNEVSINGNQLEKLEKILIDGEYEFNAFNLVRNHNDGNKPNNYDYDPVTFEAIDVTGNKNNFRGDSRENKLPSIEIKKLDSLVLYKIIKKDSIIVLTTENENFPSFTIELISNHLELMDSGYVLDFDKEIIVADNNNILKSGWAGFRWRKDISNIGIQYGYSVTIGKTYDTNKIYFNIKTFIKNKNINLILISVK